MKTADAAGCTESNGSATERHTRFHRSPDGDSSQDPKELTLVKSRLGTSESTTTARRLFWVFPDRFDTRMDKSTWLEMARHLKCLGWDVQIVATRLDPDADDYDGLIQYLDSVRFPFIFRILLLLRIAAFIRARIEPADIVMMNQDALWLAPMLRRAGAAHIHLDIRTLPITESGMKNRLDHLLFWRLPLRWFGRIPDSCSFITEPLRREFVREFNQVQQPHCIWASGVNTRLFRHTNERHATGDPGLFKLFYHGSLIRTRGIDLVLKAIAIGEFPFKIHFTVVGEGTDRAYLARMATDLGISDAVTWLGYRPYEDVVTLINEADCCVCPLPDLPEWRISSPLKVLEYLACEQLTVLTPLAAHKQVIEDAESIVWTHDYSPASFAAAFIEAYSRRTQDPKTRKDLRDWVSRNFEWEGHAKKLHDLLVAQNMNGA